MWFNTNMAPARSSPHDIVPKEVGEIVKNLIAKALRLKDFYANEVYPRPNALMYLKKRDIPPEFLHRRVVDLGCGDGNKYYVIKLLFRPKNYWGLDVLPEEIKAARRRKLRVRLLDFVKDHGIHGDLGLMIGTYTYPKLLKRLSQRFSLLFFNEYAETKQVARDVIKRYELALGRSKLRVVVKRDTDPTGWMLYFFYNPNLNKLTSNRQR